MIPVLLPGSQAISLTSLAFSPESVMLTVSRSSNCHEEEDDCSSNEYCETERSATVPDGLGLATLRLGALSICLDTVNFDIMTNGIEKNKKYVLWSNRKGPASG